MTRLSVIGLGKLGACMAACFASKGFPVIGVDVSSKVIDLVNTSRPPVFEPGLAEMMAKTEGRLKASGDYVEAVRNSDITFIVVPTPSESHGGFSLKYVREAAREIACALKHKDAYHLVVLTSTVLPGSSEYGILPILERKSGKRCGEAFGFCYNPEFIALGSVIRDFLNPDFLLIGESDARAGDRLVSVYNSACENAPPAARMALVNAELAKISVNSYVTMKITFANMLAAVCEKLPGADIDVVTSALGHDRRIGGRYLKGALGYGGPCFPRDNAALAYIARQLGLNATLAEATDSYNREIVDRLVEEVSGSLPESARVAVLGLAYKPDTNVVEESQGLQLAERLVAKGVKVVVFDPAAMASARSVLGERVRYAESLQDCLRQTDVVIITTPHKEFANIEPEDLPTHSRPTVVDAWRILRGRLEHDSRIDYRPIGVGNQASGTTSRLRDLWSDAQAEPAVEAGGR